MKRIVLILSTIVLTASTLCAAQPVAQLQVVKGSKQTASQHDRIESKLDRVLELLAAPKPPAPAPAPDPAPPKPIEPAPPAPDNPFVAWRAQGLSLVDISVWKLHRGLTDAELEQAYAAGYPRPSPRQGAAGDVPPGSIFTGPGWDLGEGGGAVKVNPVTAGAAIGPYRVVVKQGTQPRFSVFGAPGAFFEKCSYEVRDEGGRVVQSAANVPGAITKTFPLTIPPGVYYVTVRVDGSGPLGAQFQQ